MKKPNAKAGFDLQAMKRVLVYLKHYRVALVFSLLFAAANVALTLTIPLLTGRAIDEMIEIGHVDFNAVLYYALLIGGCALLSALCQ